ncbi:hypothetical protein H8784_07840 [Parabacteroides acidifaciens]|uniref:Transglutaminase domain-containing protein n=1 Tax=Parabacteroides acidifaciens TaxID=2290935 RepID=A0ABR7NZV0_9BACT|nr:hypothetical protein [Parabacteroides acidifaciens]MBC8601634.1 hypothetical protein [Parabacteroides acidifaciens]
MQKTVYILSICALISCEVKAQSNFEEFKKKTESEYSSFKKAKEKEFEDFRNKINEEYAAFMKKAWKEFDAIKGVPMPKDDKPVPPVIYPEEDKNKPIKDNPKPFEEIIPIVKPVPQPEPIAPIEDTPKPVDVYFSFNFFGTDLKVRLEEKHRFSLRSCSENDIAKTWTILSGERYNNVINDCLSIRNQNRLCDWAYLLMLRNLSKAFFKGCDNEATLFTAFLYCQSGYKMRLANADNKLYLLYASEHIIYKKSFWIVDDEKFYPLDCDLKQLYICQASYPKERPLSLQVNTEQKLAANTSPERDLQSKRFPEVKATVHTNRNLIRFFDTYPTSMINEDFGTRWAMYANTPLSQEAKSSLYPALKSVVTGKSQIDAVNRLLNFVQTAFVYEYDDKVWGYDRAFFADETLFYPYCDCEDRSILFSRLVRDLLGLKVVLIYYPGHLATAVHFSENVTGDYVAINGTRYVICDPTFIGAPVGRTMPDMDNATAKVILLE